MAPSAPTRELVERLRAPAAAPLARSLRRRRRPGCSPLVGREREFGELQRPWAAVAAGAGAAARGPGEAGIGKTRLATELRLRAARGWCARPPCARRLTSAARAPLSLWAELIRELLPALPAPPRMRPGRMTSRVLRAELPGALRPQRRPELRRCAPDLQRTRLFEAVVALLGLGRAGAPLLLVFEDVHGADRPSLELAGYAARRAGRGAGDDR